MSKGNEPAVRRRGRPPKAMEGWLALVVLSESVMRAEGIEYYGAPVAVTVWEAKLKTTLGQTRIDPECVEWWIDLEGWIGGGPGSGRLPKIALDTNGSGVAQSDHRQPPTA